MLIQTSWGLYIMQLCLWCLYGFINVFVGLLFEPPCVVLQDDGVQRVSQSLNTQWFVFLQVRNLTLAFQAAESIGIKPSLVSWSATDVTHTLITQSYHLSVFVWLDKLETVHFRMWSFRTEMPCKLFHSLHSVIVTESFTAGLPRACPLASRGKLT